VKKIIFAIFVTMVMIPLQVVYADIGNADKALLVEKIKTLERVVNKGDMVEIGKMLSPNASKELKQEINDKIGTQKIGYRQWISKMEQIAVNEVKVT